MRLNPINFEGCIEECQNCKKWDVLYEFDLHPSGALCRLCILEFDFDQKLQRLHETINDLRVTMEGNAHV